MSDRVVIEMLEELINKVDHLYNLANAQAAEVCFFCGDESAHEIESDGRVLGLCEEHDSSTWHEDDSTN